MFNSSDRSVWHCSFEHAETGDSGDLEYYYRNCSVPGEENSAALLGYTDWLVCQSWRKKQTVTHTSAMWRKERKKDVSVEMEKKLEVKRNVNTLKTCLSVFFFKWGENPSIWKTREWRRTGRRVTECVCARHLCLFPKENTIKYGNVSVWHPQVVHLSVPLWWAAI